MRVGDLFAGIGGFSLAASWLGWRTAWYSEIDPYASAVMAKRFPAAVNHGDITAIDGRSVEPVDVLCGGFPCQDISHAGKGAGIAGSRSGLWKHFARLVDEVRPRYVVAENVTALRTRGLDVVLKDLVAVGYDAEWHCVPASYVGADHQRDRIWIVAYPASIGVEGMWAEGLRIAQPLDASLLSVRDSNGQWKVEPDVRRIPDGVPRRMDRLRCLGNAVVPQAARIVLEAITEFEIRVNAN